MRPIASGDPKPDRFASTLMDTLEYLRISVYEKEGGRLDFVVKRDKTSPSIATHDGMEGHFNVTPSDWDTYLEKLKDEGWELVSVDHRNEGHERSYQFKRVKG
jgi:hypothetical protein